MAIFPFGCKKGRTIRAAGNIKGRQLMAAALFVQSILLILLRYKIRAARGQLDPGRAKSAFDGAADRPEI